jgi:Ethanolamine utilization protein EutJ (predicted chaperonin)
MNQLVATLYKSNSVGSHHLEPTTIGWRYVSDEEAEDLKNKKLENGFYWRIQSVKEIEQKLKEYIFG